MAKNQASKGVKRALAAAKKGPSATSAGNREDSSTLPSPEDAKRLAKTPVPAPVEGRVIHNISSAFTARLVKFLQRTDFREFIGSRLKPAEVLEATETALDFEAIAQRMLHGAAIAQRIAAPKEKFLVQQAQLIVDNAPAFLEENPGFEDELKDLLDWWTATFPGGGPKPANGGDSSGNPVAVTTDQKKS